MAIPGSRWTSRLPGKGLFISVSYNDKIGI
jgi:hypothetical protein